MLNDHNPTLTHIKIATFELHRMGEINKLWGWFWCNNLWLYTCSILFSISLNRGMVSVPVSTFYFQHFALLLPQSSNALFLDINTFYKSADSDPWLKKKLLNCSEMILTLSDWHIWKGHLFVPMTEIFNSKCDKTSLTQYDQIQQ